MRPIRRELILFGLSAAILLWSYHWIYSPFFAYASDNGIGDDYGYFLPLLLDGYYWYLNNGPFSTPWFTAAFCGAVPAFPNPQNIYFSVPQWLSFATDPHNAVYLTMLLFALLGFGGFYILLRRSFQTSQATALLAAALFMFNGFFAHRLLIGHLSFHAFMLVPLIAWLLLPAATPARSALPGRLFRISLAGLLFAYVVHSGGAQLILPTFIMLSGIGLIHGMRHGVQRVYWLNLGAAGLLGIAVSLAKLVAVLAFLDNFERSDYLLPGAASIAGLLKLWFEVLFLQPSGITVNSVMVNSQWRLEPHDFEYGITLIPLLMLLLAIPTFMRARTALAQTWRAPAWWLQALALLLLMLLPLAVNYYTPAWNALLKETPIIRSVSILIRWLCIYIPIILLIAALAFERIEALKKVRPYLALAGMLSVIIMSGYKDRDHYEQQEYNPARIIDAHAQAQSSGTPVTIEQNLVFKDKNGELLAPIFRNDTLVMGGSQLICYEPIFGYGLENFPIKLIHPGPVADVVDGYLNLKNPACYVYGASNGCEPGDHFSVAQADKAKALAAYHPFEFELPASQRIANTITLLTLLAIALFWLAYPFLRRRALRQG